MTPDTVYIKVGDTLHRGYRDGSGLFTLEQDNLDAAREAGNLEVLEEGVEAVGKRCQNCFLNA